jgi:pyruvate,water dikinase
MSAILVKWLNETGLEEIELVGGKNASLGEMIRNLSKHCDVPSGFIITSHAFQVFMDSNKLDERIHQLLEATDVDNLESLMKCGSTIRNLIHAGKVPGEISDIISEYYSTFSKEFGEESVDVAVRSSGTAEDLPDASFAGQQDTYLNVRGVQSLLIHVKACFASLYTDRAISYRKTMGYTKPVRISICIQKMVRSDLGCSGVAFSIHPDSGFSEVICINGAYGLGELVVSGQVKPDEFIVFKPTLYTHSSSIISKSIGSKTQKMVYASEKRVDIVATSIAECNSFCLTDTQVLQLAGWVIEIEKYYSNKYGRWCPVDVEWALDGASDRLYIVQARPETIHSRKTNAGEFIEYKLNVNADAKVLCKGIAVGQSIGVGAVRHISSISSAESSLFAEGDILVTEYTDPTFEPLMKKASAIVTDKGGRTSHAAIVSREMGKPAIVGCGDATTSLNEGDTITVCCSIGNTGIIYEGALSFTTIRTDLTSLPSTSSLPTKIMMNVGNPDNVFKYHKYPVDGVGLAREEFIIANYIGVHPNAVLNIDTMSPEIQADITTRACGYPSVRDWYVQRLSHGIGLISATFYPRPVIVRFSDFKTNEYRDLVGGSTFEPSEENPMLGFRGCSRYYSKEFKESFKLECEAISLVRNGMGLTNTLVMLPFCRTVNECIKTLDTMREFGLERGKDGLQVYLMCEIPSNVILADEFCKHVDGFSIGSNDLTQLCLGLDRDSGIVTHIGNETDPAVKQLIRMAIKACKRNGVKIGICGQGPSDIPEFADFLIQEGIDTISLIPDSVRDFLMRFSIE